MWENAIWHSLCQIALSLAEKVLLERVKLIDITNIILDYLVTVAKEVKSDSNSDWNKRDKPKKTKQKRHLPVYTRSFVEIFVLPLKKMHRKSYIYLKKKKKNTHIRVDKVWVQQAG